MPGMEHVNRCSQHIGKQAHHNKVLSPENGNKISYKHQGKCVRILCEAVCFILLFSRTGRLRLLQCKICLAKQLSKSRTWRFNTTIIKVMILSQLHPPSIFLKVHRNYIFPSSQSSNWSFSNRYLCLNLIFFVSHSSYMLNLS